jgi:hypothetical protein
MNKQEQTLKFNPKQYGLSGELALCVYCRKTTEYKICCDSIDGLFAINSENIWDLVFSYSLDTFEIEVIEKSVIEFETRSA